MLRTGPDGRVDAPDVVEEAVDVPAHDLVLKPTLSYGFE